MNTCKNCKHFECDVKFNPDFGTCDSKDVYKMVKSDPDEIYPIMFSVNFGCILFEGKTKPTISDLLIPILDAVQLYNMAFPNNRKTVIDVVEK